ncbi:LysR family transcriptional regulator [Motiliproteus coralliicola]|uniref:LysR family transcriptional regulator n=1 Tax=Motiliproteus coralliicola TaxID=2283196 RepID=A0A369WQC9_9GAMM|nr:LysR family transcriptional regulator [Motiliproteus coralliicola]RDE24280.1 LysR family transcriptional regulator [Motiliproteus coralliicola]
MIDDLRALAIFAELSRQGSFRATAERLGLSPSVVSYHLSQLEKRLGTALLYRSTRKISLTAEGRQLQQHALAMLEAAQQGLEALDTDRDKVGGVLRITLPTALARAPVSAGLARFHRRYPGIEMHLSYTDQRQDLLADGIDLAIRAGSLPDSSLKAKRIGQIDRKLVCSPALIEAFGAVQKPELLSHWPWIRLAMMPPRRTLIGPDGSRHELSFDASIVVDSVEALAELCWQGAGLATPSTHLIESSLASGELIEPLPQWRIEPIALHAVWPANAGPHSNSRRLLEFLAQQPEILSC